VKVLLDENLDHALRKLLGPHDVATVTYMGWAGLKNGELLRAAEDAGFDVFLTGDQMLAHGQNLVGRRLAIIALSAMQLPILRENLAKITAAIGSAAPGSFRLVECGTFSRRKPPVQSRSGSRLRKFPEVSGCIPIPQPASEVAEAHPGHVWKVLTSIGFRKYQV
jgi:hypothetical protein